jgi:hypothetical protein
MNRPLALLRFTEMGNAFATPRVILAKAEIHFTSAKTNGFRFRGSDDI